MQPRAKGYAPIKRQIIPRDNINRALYLRIGRPVAAWVLANSLFLVIIVAVPARSRDGS